MNLTDLNKGKNPMVINHSIEDTPHITIETNHTCNIKCRSCYNFNNTFVKEYEDIIHEINQGIGKRKVLAITLIGGEPTLHPKLPEIIRYIKSKKVLCQLLTNGIRFNEDPEDRLLDEITAAGLDKILLHVDEGQTGIHSNLDNVIHTLFKKFEKRKIFYSLSVTIFYDTQGLIPDKIRKFASYKYFDGILGLLSRNMLDAIQENASDKKWSKLVTEYKSVADGLEIYPTAYLPTSLAEDDISWLFFFFYINSKTGSTFSRSPQILKLFSKLYRFFTGKNVFGLNFTPFQFYIVFAVSSIIELLINPRRIRSLFQLMKKSAFLGELRIHTIVIQNPPQYNPEKKQVQFCYHCPDATIRNGKLTPLCLADYINPIKGVRTENKQVPAGLRELVYEHLNEIEKE